MKSVLTTLLFLLVLPGLLFANGNTTDDGKTDVYVTDADVSVAAGPNIHWTNDNNYILTEGVFVDDGVVLTVDSGTVIKGQPGLLTEAKYLCIARGGQAFMNGTENYPIIMCPEADDVDDLFDFPWGTFGLWGGLLILGEATIADPAGENNIEGIPTSEPRGTYGGSDDNDNSGSFTYISVRHAGVKLSDANEINGITMGAVGDGTVMDYLEVFNNLDDGYEWFGGTVNTKHLITAYCGDDMFDYDEGFRGHGQFWFGLQDPEYGNRGGEHDGAVDPEDQTPWAHPIIYNVTYIGSGTDADFEDQDRALYHRDNAGGKYHNSIFTEFGDACWKVEDLASGEDSYARLAAGDLKMEHIFWYGFGNYDGTTASLFETDIDNTLLINYVEDPANAHNIEVDPMLVNVNRAEGGQIDPRLDPASPANTPGNDEPTTPTGFFDDVSYHGAFQAAVTKDDTGLWFKPWSYLWAVSRIEYNCGNADGAGPVDISDAVYIINLVFVPGAPDVRPAAAGDVDCSGRIDVSDAVYLINLVFVTGSPSPCDPDGDDIPNC